MYYKFIMLMGVTGRKSLGVHVGTIQGGILQSSQCSGCYRETTKTELKLNPDAVITN